MTYRVTKRAGILLALFLIVTVIIPLSARAGFFSELLGTEKQPVAEAVFYAADSNPQTMPLLKAAINTDPTPAKGGGDIVFDDGVLISDAGFAEDDYVNTQTANGEISIYKVNENDTLSEIAEMFGVSAETILWANDIRDADLIRPDMELTILPITGVRHVVKDGETLRKIALKYEEDDENIDEIVDEIVSYNRLASADDISVGDTVIIPGGHIAAPVRTQQVAPARVSGNAVVASGGGSSGFIDPLPSGICSQGIHGYNGVDMAAGYGTPIRAAADGQVIVSKGGGGWNGGYGNYVVIKHPNGTQTLYSHNSSNAVGVGQSVAAGQTIAYVGSTGRSTGNHLHFEVRGARNPFCN